MPCTSWRPRCLRISECQTLVRMQTFKQLSKFICTTASVYPDANLQMCRGCESAVKASPEGTRHFRQDRNRPSSDTERHAETDLGDRIVHENRERDELGDRDGHGDKNRRKSHADGGPKRKTERTQRERERDTRRKHVATRVRFLASSGRCSSTRALCHVNLKSLNQRVLCHPWELELFLCGGSSKWSASSNSQLGVGHVSSLPKGTIPS